MNFPAPLNALSPEELTVLAGHMQTVRFPAETCIFPMHSEGDCCYLLDEGTVRLQLDQGPSEVDSDSILGWMNEGTVLGELALLDNLPRSASAWAQTDVVARRLGRDDLETIQTSHPHLAAALITVLGRSASIKLRQATVRLAEALFIPHDQAVDDMVERAVRAQTEMEAWPEPRIDALLGDLASAIADRAQELAEATVKETRIGNVQSKEHKNRVASLIVYDSLQGSAAHGCLEEKDLVTEVVSPVGVIFGLVPITSPVATFIFKTLVAVKGRNALILSPHHMTLGVCARVQGIVSDVLVRHGAQADLVQSISERSSRHQTAQFMSHRHVSLVLATGGASMVKAAYSSGKPAIGVGPGNTPTLIGDDVDVVVVAEKVIASKSYDNGLVCGSEHNLVAVASVRDRLVEALEQRGAAVLTESEIERFTSLAVDPATRHFVPKLIGQAAARIAAATGIERPWPIRLIVVPTSEISSDNPYAREKLAPILSLFTVADAEAGLRTCRSLLAVDGMGHSAAIHSHDPGLIKRFAQHMPVSRILVNTPAVSGIVGVTTGLVPSFTLGCGTFGGTSTTDNVTWRHLVNIKRLAVHDEQRTQLAGARLHGVGV